MTSEELKYAQSRSPERKVMVTDAKILEACVYCNWKIAVSFSGGKDSCVLFDRVCRIWAQEKPDTPLVAVFANTGMEHAGMLEFCKEFCSIMEYRHGVKIDFRSPRPKSNFRSIVLREGYPIASKKTSRYIRDIKKWALNPRANWPTVSKIVQRLLRQKRPLSAMKLLKLHGAPDSVVLYLTGYNSKKRKSPSFKLAYRWWPIIDSWINTSERCCDFLKKLPIQSIEKDMGLSSLIAEMAADSQQRRAAWLQTGCNAFKDGKVKSKPMGPWLEQDVLWYHDNYNLPHFHMYGELKASIEFVGGDIHCDDNYKVIYKFTGEQHTGCKLCMFGIQCPGEEDRFFRLMETEPQTVMWAMRPIRQGGLGIAEVIDFLNEHCGCKIQTTYSAAFGPGTERITRACS